MKKLYVCICGKSFSNSQAYNGHKAHCKEGKSEEQKLKYKAMMNESSVINVSPKYTSQTCPICGHTEKANRNKKIHFFCCKNCGYKSNDDRIGAMNLYRMGIDYLSSKVPDTVTSE